MPFLNRRIRSAHNRLAKALKEPETKERFRRLILNAKEQDRTRCWDHSRPTKEHPTFLKGPQGNITDLVRIQIKQFGKIRILDLGAGGGLVFDELHSEFGAKIESTALTTGQIPVLETRQRTGAIQKIIIGEAAAWLPKEKYHLIISSGGGLYFTMFPEIAFAKTLGALERGGLPYIQPAHNIETGSFRKIILGLNRKKYQIVKFPGPKSDVAIIRKL